MKLPRVVSREYKIMMDHRLFTDRKPAMESFLGELRDLAELLRVGFEIQKEKSQKRQIVFLDTLDNTILLNGLIFRRRTDEASGQSEYTLKYRSPDRYLAASAEIGPAELDHARIKFEEDISAPFRAQFSYSATVSGPDQSPSSLNAAAAIFPGLAKVYRDGDLTPGHTRLYPVNAMTIYERVLKGPKLNLEGTEAQVAVILWSIGESGRPMVAEFSFRYGDKQENYTGATAKKSKQLFESLQKLDWFLPEGKTKTQFAYHA